LPNLKGDREKVCGLVVIDKVTNMRGSNPAAKKTSNKKKARQKKKKKKKNGGF